MALNRASLPAAGAPQHLRLPDEKHKTASAPKPPAARSVDVQPKTLKSTISGPPASASISSTTTQPQTEQPSVRTVDNPHIVNGTFPGTRLRYDPNQAMNPNVAKQIGLTDPMRPLNNDQARRRSKFR